MTELDITPELEAKIAKAIMENKPYLIAIEDLVQQVKHGVIDVKLEVRGSIVEKMSFFETKSWLRVKIDENTKRV